MERELTRQSYIFWAEQGCTRRDVIAAAELNIIRDNNRLAFLRDPPVTPETLRASRESKAKKPYPGHPGPRWTWWFYSEDLQLISPSRGNPVEWWENVYGRKLTKQDRKVACEAWLKQEEEQARQRVPRRSRAQQRRQQRRGR